MDEGKGAESGPVPEWWSRPRPRPGGTGRPRASGRAETEAPRPGAGEPGAAPSGRSPDGLAADRPPDADAALGGRPAEVAPREPGDEPVDGHRSVAGSPRQRPTPRHEPDPYHTPPYGDPGPWAPAPPVQRPGPTPAHGTPSAGRPADDEAGPVPDTPRVGWASPYTDPAADRPAVAEDRWSRYDPWDAMPSGAVAPPAPAPRPRRRGRLLAGAALVALVAGGVGGAAGAYFSGGSGLRGPGVKLSQAPAEDAKRDPGSVAGIAARSLPGVVTIHVAGAGKQATGTGFVLDAKGHILTNNHVVEEAEKGGDISVTFSGGEATSARLVGRDGGYDLAVIKVSRVSGLRPLPLGNSDSVRVGDSVVAIGSPYDLAGTVTSGIISAKDRPITAGGQESDGSDISYVDALQTDAPINPGNSGGPLVDAKGRVIGVNSAIRSADDNADLGSGAGGSIGLGFAIPINQGKRVAEQLINTGQATHPVIGVTLDMSYTGDGARVADDEDDAPSVTPDGPGDKAGIRPKDVITALDGVRVHSGQELIVKVRSHRPGDRLALTVKRAGAERAVQLTLGEDSGD